MVDRILVFISMAALLVFLGVVIGFVAEPDLIVVTMLMFALAAHDFWKSVFKTEQATAQEDLPLESLPTGVSGKPLPPREKSSGKSSRGKQSSRRKKK